MAVRTLNHTVKVTTADFLLLFGMALGKAIVMLLCPPPPAEAGVKAYTAIDNFSLIMQHLIVAMLLPGSA